MMKAVAHCACGELELQVSSPPIVQLTCHCRDCQAFSGRDFVDGAFFRKDSCRIRGKTASETLQGGTGADKLQHSCASCGEPLYVQVGALNGAIAILASRLSPFTFESEAHIWTSHSVDGTKIPEGVPQTSGPPPDDLVERMINGFWKQ